MSDNNIKIIPLPNGPLMVANLTVLKDATNTNLNPSDEIYLCRCGLSKNKPYCDGSHKEVGFTGEREIDKPIDRERDYEGEKITIHDNRVICSHAEACVHRLSKVFNAEARPWIDPDKATVEEVDNLVKLCPSGALSYTVEGKKVKDYDRDPEVKIMRNGPYNVTGYIELDVDDELKPPSKEHYSLCRCGASKNKPYCDGEHHNIGFEG